LDDYGDGYIARVCGGRPPEAITVMAERGDLQMDPAMFQKEATGM
jgi:hypothetical protein